LVGARGFEPRTPCAQGRCATRLRYAPTCSDVTESTPFRIINDGTRYNFFLDMQSLRYALVAYVKSPVGEFVENLRRELHPDLPHHAAHITFLPPRLLQGTESAALQLLAGICGQAHPFEVSLGEMESFVPTTPTVYIRVAQGASRLEELHERLNTQALSFAEEWPYIPHLTIVKMMHEPAAQQALQIARERWRQYSGSRRVRLERLTFVREDALNCWVDLAPVPLGGSLVSP
jgi:2'-5' RNA ligase